MERRPLAGLALQLLFGCLLRARREERTESAADGDRRQGFPLPFQGEQKGR